MRNIILFFSFSAIVFGQSYVRSYTVATLPSASSTSGQTAMVTDGISVADCTTGGGTFAVPCKSNGLGYSALQIGSGGGNVSTSGNMVAGHVPQSTGATTLSDGGQSYPAGPFADTNSAQAFFNKDFTSSTNTFPANPGNAGLGANTFTGTQTIKPNSGESLLQLDTTGTGQQDNIGFYSNGVLKWLILKQTNDTFAIFDEAHSNSIIATDTSGNVLSSSPIWEIPSLQLTTPLGTLYGGTGNNTGSIPNALTANSLSTTPSLCSVGNAPAGILAIGSATGCNPTESCLNIVAFGGDNVGTGSNNSAWTAALAFGQQNHQCIYFPRGTYLFTTTPVWNSSNAASSITVRGDGQDVSQLFFPSGQNGLTINLQATTDAFHIRGMSLRTNGVNNASGLVIQGSQTANAEGVQSDIDDVALYGGDCPGCTDYWTAAINIINFPVINFSRIHIVGQPIMSGTSGLGTGILLSANSASPGVAYNLSQIEGDYLGQGVQVQDHIQGFNLSQSNFTGVNTGVYVPPGIPYGDNDQLVISTTQFNASSNGINIQSPVRHTNIGGNYFVVPGAANGIILNNYAMSNVHDNQFINGSGGGGNGIVFGTYNNSASTNDVSSVSNNTTQFFTTGIFLQSGSQNVSILPGNAGSGNTNTIVNSGTNNIVPVSCPAGTPSSSYTVVNGIVTHC